MPLRSRGTPVLPVALLLLAVLVAGLASVAARAGAASAGSGALGPAASLREVGAWLATPGTTPSLPAAGVPTPSVGAPAVAVRGAVAPQVPPPPTTQPPPRPRPVAPRTSTPAAGRPVGAGAPAAAPAVAAPDRLAAVRGLSTWVDLFDYGDAGSAGGPAAAAGLAEAAANYGASSIWVQVSRYNTRDIAEPHALAALIDRAHQRGLRVVAWTFPQLTDTRLDVRQGVAAAAFRTGTGQAVDAVALDIESRDEQDVATRDRRLLDLTAQLHRGLRVPLVAITVTPQFVDQKRSYWPAFPYRALAATVDAIAPMSYWSLDGDPPGAFIATAIDRIRQEVGNPRYPVHVIGGLAGDSKPADVLAMCQAAKQHAATGAGLYDLSSTTAGEWPALQRCR